jgi:hypothetical protein
MDTAQVKDELRTALTAHPCHAGAGYPDEVAAIA